MSEIQLENITDDICACLITLRNRSVRYFQQKYYQGIYYIQWKKSILMNLKCHIP